MKKIFSKILVVLLLLLTITEFSLSNKVYATAPDVTSAGEIAADVVVAATNWAGGIYSILIWGKRIVALGLAYAIDHAFYEMASQDNNEALNLLDFSIKFITPFDIFFDHYQLLDINIFDLNTVKTDSVSYRIRSNVAVWFYTMRLIASVILLAILVYVGIKMAISTVASDKAKYKKMLIDWAISLILIYIIHYLAIFIIYINKALIRTLEALSAGVIEVQSISDVYSRIALLATVGSGIPSITATIVFCGMVFMSIAFFVAYINRVIKVAFLMIISPLISITYSIDKMKDRKAQALEKWFKEFLYTILIQPFHCIMYLAFTNTSYKLLLPYLDTSNTLGGRLAYIAGTLANTMGANFMVGTDMNLVVTSVFVILSLIFIKQAEDVVRKIFGFSDSNKSTSLGAGMAMSLMAVNQAKKIGTTTRKTVNAAKNVPHNLKRAAEKDWDKIKDTKIGKSISQGASKINSEIAKASDSMSNSKYAKGAKSFTDNITDSFTNSGLYRSASGAKRKITGFANGAVKAKNRAVNAIGDSRVGKFLSSKKFKGAWKYVKEKNSIASVIGSMYGISQIINGDSPLEAYADSVAVEQGVNAFMNTGEDKLAEGATYSATELDKIEYSNAVENYYRNTAQGEDPLQNALNDIGYASIEEYRRVVEEDRQRNNNRTYQEIYDENNSKAKENKRKAIVERKSGNTDEADRLEAEAKAFEEEAKKFKKLADEEAKIEGLKAQKDFIDNFYKAETIAERAVERASAPTKKEFKDASKALRQELERLIKERKQINGQGGFVTEDDLKAAEEVQKAFDEIIKISVGAEEEVDFSELLEDRLDLTEDDDPEMYASLMQKMNNIRQLQLQKRFSDAFEPLSSVDGLDERFGKAVAREQLKRMDAERRAKERRENV